jgi:hypothetical protein
MSSSKRKSTSKKITTSDNNSLALGVIDHIAKMLLEGYPISKISDYLSDNVADYRDVFTKVTNDEQCNKAREQANKLRNPELSPVINYKGSSERDNNTRLLNPDNTFKKNISKMILRNGEDFKRSSNKIEILEHYDDDDYDYEDNRPFNWQMIPITENKKKRTKIYFDPAGRGYCGDCWLCGLPVYYYFDYENVTGCGECEHIGGIVASILSGMLTSSIQQSSWSNYGSSHPHCNQNKGDFLSMKFDRNNNQWKVDEDGIATIINNINARIIHANEYDHEFIRNHIDKIQNNLPQKRREMTIRIRNYTNQWCSEANQTLNNERTANYAKRISNIILISYNSVRDKLEKAIRTKKKTGGLILGDRRQFINDNINAPFNHNIEDNMLTKILTNKTKINEKIDSEHRDKEEKMVEEEEIEDEDVILPLINGFDVDMLTEVDAQTELNKLLAIPDARQLFENLITAIDNYFNEIYKEDIDTLNKIKVLDNNVNQFIQNSSNQIENKISHGGNKKNNKRTKKSNVHKKQNKHRNKTHKKLSKTLSTKKK